MRAVLMTLRIRLSRCAILCCCDLMGCGNTHELRALRRGQQVGRVRSRRGAVIRLVVIPTMAIVLFQPPI